MLKITAYSDQISVAPGDKIKFMVNCEYDSYQADIVRIICGDENPDGPGFKEAMIKTPVSGSYKGRKQQIYAGSYVVVPNCAQLDDIESFTVQANIWPTTPTKGLQGIVSKWSEDDKSGFALVIDEKGSVALMLGNGRSATIVSAGKPMLACEWYFAGATYDARTKEVAVYQEPLIEYATIDDGGSVTRKATAGAVSNKAPLVMAAWFRASLGAKGTVAGGHMNGKIDNPRLAVGLLTRAQMESLRGPGLPPGPLQSALIGAWDFAADISDTRVTDLSSHRLHGETVNMPTRGVTGYNWRGDELCWRHARDQYGAIHFHDDDVYDAQWGVDFELTVPDDMTSGLYAARIRAGDSEEYVPFAVRPKPGKEKKILFLLPTASYMAYANEHFATDPWLLELMTHRAVELFPHSIFLNEHREYGHALYDYHSDGSGVAISSRLRPVLNMRPKVQTVLGGDGSQLWQLAADTHITDWLTKLRFEFDVQTDEDLHYKGTDLLKPYSVVVTGTHPEYYSKSMYDAVYNYTHQGGRLMYMGGNGFYWRISYHLTKPGVIEIRRAEGGSRAWAPKSGEYYTGFTGEYGGMWRRQGSTGPNVIAGVGFAAEGFDVSSYYRRNPDSFDKRARFIFEGVGKDELIGNFGLIGGGAAGLELDRVDRGLGTPPHALNLASSENHTDAMLQVVEDILFNYPGTGGQENENCRADLVFFETPNGGGVFSVSSMAWAGSLSYNNYKNNISRITENVLRRFVDPEPLA